jgi:hypothetical protein
VKKLVIRLAFLLALLSVHRATAATFMVTSLANSGLGSLRQAVRKANASKGADQVVFAPGLTGTITLTTGEILITDPLVIHGPGAGVITVSGNDRSRIFHVENSGVAAPIDVTLSGLKLTRGFSASGLVAGGAVFAESENLTIVDSVISDSTSGAAEDPPPNGCGGNVGFFGTSGGTLRIVNSRLIGGAARGLDFLAGGNLCVYKGRLMLERVTLAGGTARQGGGLFVSSLTENSRIVLSTISGNRADDSGGGIFSPSLGAVLTIVSSTISGNTGGLPSPSYTGFGGGIEIDQGNLRIINSTISGNHANGAGGGIVAPAGADSSLLLRLTTVANNTAGRTAGSILVGLVGGPTPAVQLDHSIVANGAPQDLAGLPAEIPATFAADHSLIGDPGDALLVGAHNRIGADPLLGPLADNGGPTQTHRPLAGSPVIDAGDPAIPSPPATDQRGSARIAGAAIDLGSVEVQ